MLLPDLDTLNKRRILLASASVNRNQILEKAGLKFEVSPSGFAEDLPKSDFATSMDYVLATSGCKLNDKLQEIQSAKQQNAQNLQPVDMVISSDTIISMDDSKVVEKPQNDEHAFAMLRELCDRKSHQVYTAVWISVLDPSTQQELLRKSLIEKTTVHFAPMTDEQVRAYVATGEPFGKAGGYGIQGAASTFVTGIEGCFYNVWGFPLAHFCKALKEMMSEGKEKGLFE